MRLVERLPTPAFTLTDELQSSLLQQIASPREILSFQYSALQNRNFDIRKKLQQRAEELQQHAVVASESYFQNTSQLQILSRQKESCVTHIYAFVCM